MKSNKKILELSSVLSLYKMSNFSVICKGENDFLRELEVLTVYPSYSINV